MIKNLVGATSNYQCNVMGRLFLEYKRIKDSKTLKIRVFLIYTLT